MKKISNWIPFTGYTLLVAMVLTLLLSASYEAWRFHPVTGIIAVIVMIGALFAIIDEGKSILENIKANKPYQLHKPVYEFLAVVVGGIVTYYLSINLSLGEVVASALVGIIAHMILPEYGAAAYCGSFVGMSSNMLLFNNYEVALASVVAGVVFVLTTKVFAGVGGKLGTIALIGASTMGIGLQRQFATAPISDLDTSGLIILIAMIAASLTFYLNCTKNNGAVLASGFVGLIGGLLLPIIFPVYGNKLAVVAICASFTGMASENRCSAFWHIIVAGFFTGILFIFSEPLLGGAGGKLGTIAFASILSIFGFTHFFKQFYGTDTRMPTN